MRGVLRGRNLNNVLAPAPTTPTIEISDDDSDTDKDDGDENRPHPKQQPTHSTRASRYGTAPVNYDMKYHPMDEITRPKRAAKRRSGSRSKSASTRLDLDQTTEDDSDLSTGHEVDSDEESEDEDDSAPEAVITSTRAPDPRASRHSARSEAQKPVNYSRKSHPQDYGLPGFQHKAGQRHGSASHTTSKARLKRKSIVVNEDSADDDANQETEPTKVTAKPRKKLKSLSSSSPTTVKAKAKSKSGKSRKQRAKVTKDPITDELDLLTEELCRDAPKPRKPLVKSQSDAEGEQEGKPSQTKERSITVPSVQLDGSDSPIDVASVPFQSSNTIDAPDSAEDLDTDEMGEVLEELCRDTPAPQVNEDDLDPELAATEPSTQVHNLQQGPPPPSQDRLIIVRPHFTGYETTELDLRSGMIRCPVSQVDMQLKAVKHDGHSIAGPSPVPNTPAGSPPRRAHNGTYADGTASPSTLVGASGSVPNASGHVTSRAPAAGGTSPDPEVPGSKLSVPKLISTHVNLDDGSQALDEFETAFPSSPSEPV